MFVSAETGIPQTQEHFDNHAAYVDYWIKALKEDPNALFKAVNQAQKASEEILKYERVREREQNQEQTLLADEKPVLTEKMIKDLKLIEGDCKVFLKPRIDGQQYKGKVLRIDENLGVCIQQVGNKSLVAHKLEKMDKIPTIGESVKISYDAKGEKAKISVQEEHHHCLRR